MKHNLLKTFLSAFLALTRSANISVYLRPKNMAPVIGYQLGIDVPFHFFVVGSSLRE
jgi:hypothetical protein